MPVCVLIFAAVCLCLCNPQWQHVLVHSFWMACVSFHVVMLFLDSISADRAGWIVLTVDNNIKSGLSITCVLPTYGALSLFQNIYVIGSMWHKVISVAVSQSRNICWLKRFWFIWCNCGVGYKTDGMPEGRGVEWFTNIYKIITNNYCTCYAVCACQWQFVFAQHRFWKLN